MSERAQMRGSCFLQSQPGPEQLSWGLWFNHMDGPPVWCGFLGSGTAYKNRRAFGSTMWLKCRFWRESGLTIWPYSWLDWFWGATISDHPWNLVFNNNSTFCCFRRLPCAEQDPSVFERKETSVGKARWNRWGRLPWAWLCQSWPSGSPTHFLEIQVSQETCKPMFWSREIQVFVVDVWSHQASQDESSASKEVIQVLRKEVWWRYIDFRIRNQTNLVSAAGTSEGKGNAVCDATTAGRRWFGWF